MPPLTSSEDRLRKVLELERSKGCNDRAVTAGLDTFLKNLTRNDARDLTSSVFAQLQSLPVAGYRSLTPLKRKAWLESVLITLKATPSPVGVLGESPGRQPAAPNTRTTSAARSSPTSIRPTSSPLSTDVERGEGGGG